MKRLDLRLVELGLAPTRTKAQRLIEAGEVRVGAQVIRQSSFKTDAPAGEIQINPDAPTLKYVSRGGLKLEAALAYLQLNVNGWRCLDVGLSTGGFSDCLLQHGAFAIAGFDVGHGQLHAQLAKDARLQAWEGLHARDLPAHPELRAWLGQGVDLTVVDVSFIGLAQVLPFLPKGRLLALVKPQFEVGPDHLSRRGIVTDEKLFDEVRTRVLHDLEKYGFTVKDYFACAVKGQDGNQEFFAFAERG